MVGAGTGAWVVGLSVAFEELASLGAGEGGNLGIEGLKGTGEFGAVGGRKSRLNGLFADKWK